MHFANTQRWLRPLRALIPKELGISRKEVNMGYLLCRDKDA